MSCFSACVAIWANALPHSTSRASVEYRYFMRSSSVDLGADVLHQLRVFRVFAADLGGKLIGRGDPGLDAAGVRQPFLDVGTEERSVHLRTQAGERSFRSTGRREQTVPLDHDEVGIELGDRRHLGQHPRALRSGESERAQAARLDL